MRRTPRGRSTSPWPGLRCAWLLAGAIASGTLPAAAQLADDTEEVPSRLRFSGNVTASQHNVHPAYFGGNFGFDRKNFSWGEGFVKLRVRSDLLPGVQFGAGAVALGTLGRDYVGLSDTGEIYLDDLWGRLDHILDSPVSLTVGRQEIDVGDGFLFGDGIADREGASWNIPLRAFDAIRLDTDLERLHVMLLAIRMGSRFFQLVYDPEDPTGFALLEPRGEMYGGDATFDLSETTAFGATFLWRSDTGPSNVDARVGSVRARTAVGPIGLAGEFALEGGEFRDQPLDAYAWHADAHWNLPLRLSPYVELSYAFFSGDNDATDEIEEYFPWNFHWTDWSKYYIGDYVSNMLLQADARIWRLEGGCTLTESVTLRALFHRFDLDTGSYVLGLPAGVGRHFADEVDVVADFAVTEEVSAWVMGSWAAPGAAGEYAWGTEDAYQLFLSATYEF